MIFPGATKQQALAAAEHVRESIARHGFTAAAQQPLGCISVSGGVSECPVDATDSAALVRLADEALYEAKRSGRNRVLPFAPRYLGEEDAQEPVGDEEAERTQRHVVLGGPGVSPLDPARAPPRVRGELRRGATSAGGGRRGRALAAARRARQIDPERRAAAQLAIVIEQQLLAEDRDLVVVDERRGRGARRPPPAPEPAARPRQGLCENAAAPAGVAKLADARDSKSREGHPSCGFDSHLRHQPSPPASTVIPARWRPS